MEDNTKVRPVLNAVFKDHDSARQGFQAARSFGYSFEDIDVLMFNDTRSKQFGNYDGKRNRRDSRAAEVAGIGGAFGGTVGAIAAVLSTVGGSISIPGLGLDVAGPLAAALAGVGAGGVAGTLLGAIVGWSIPDEHVKRYEANLRDGGILLGLRPRSDDDARRLAKHWGSPPNAGVADSTSRL